MSRWPGEGDMTTAGAAPPGRRPRPYAATGGRTRKADTVIGVATQVTGTRRPGTRPMSDAHLRLLAMCRTPRAVAELAALMGLPVGIVIALTDDLVRYGAVTATEPLDMSTPSNRTNVVEMDQHLLRRVYDGLTRSLQAEGMPPRDQRAR